LIAIFHYTATIYRDTLRLDTWILFNTGYALVRGLTGLRVKERIRGDPDMEVDQYCAWYLWVTGNYTTYREG
jgi:hypothetical protein